MKKNAALFLVYFAFSFGYVLPKPVMKIAPLPGKVNTSQNEFGPSLSFDGKTLYFYSKGRGSRYNDLFMSRVSPDGIWGKPIPLSPLNSPYDDQSPFISDSDQFIIFSSNRDGSREFRLSNGKIGVSRDLYYSEVRNGRWSKPQPLPSVNTDQIEENPYMYGNDLYFTRYPFDKSMEAKIYKASYQNNTLTNPVELPSPINLPPYSSLAAIISGDGKTIYFSSNRPGGYGGYDIYKSNINSDGTYSEPENLGPEINTEGNETYFTIHKQNGSIIFCRNKTTEHFDFDIYTAVLEEEKPPPKQDEIAKTLKEKKKLSLNNINFNINSSELLPESYPHLDKIADYMKENPNLKIKIIGHTDMTGDKELNQPLSEDRAKSVKSYFVSKGIVANRIFTDGKGATQPLINSIEPEANKQNRRTEFEIIE
ncbi:MAG: OmpA family protein [Leptospiraceae bacterium]|nr:OmpA family protein [Leptospiraceae bacterium]MCP5496222.1 OmpA family protein [Leptospiraceae bacterium]